MQSFHAKFIVVGLLLAMVMWMAVLELGSSTQHSRSIFVHHPRLKRSQDAAEGGGTLKRVRRQNTEGTEAADTATTTTATAATTAAETELEATETTSVTEQSIESNQTEIEPTEVEQTVTTPAENNAATLQNDATTTSNVQVSSPTHATTIQATTPQATITQATTTQAPPMTPGPTTTLDELATTTPTTIMLETDPPTTPPLQEASVTMQTTLRRALTSSIVLTERTHPQPTTAAISSTATNVNTTVGVITGIGRKGDAESKTTVYAAAGAGGGLVLIGFVAIVGYVTYIKPRRRFSGTGGGFGGDSVVSQSIQDMEMAQAWVAEEAEGLDEQLIGGDDNVTSATAGESAVNRLRAASMVSTFTNTSFATVQKQDAWALFGQPNSLVFTTPSPVQPGLPEPDLHGTMLDSSQLAELSFNNSDVNMTYGELPVNTPDPEFYGGVAEFGGWDDIARNDQQDLSYGNPTTPSSGDSNPLYASAGLVRQMSAAANSSSGRSPDIRVARLVQSRPLPGQGTGRIVERNGSSEAASNVPADAWADPCVYDDVSVLLQTSNDIIRSSGDVTLSFGDGAAQAQPWPGEGEYGNTGEATDSLIGHTNDSMHDVTTEKHSEDAGGIIYESTDMLDDIEDWDADAPYGQQTSTLDDEQGAYPELETHLPGHSPHSGSSAEQQPDSSTAPASPAVLSSTALQSATESEPPAGGMEAKPVPEISVQSPTGSSADSTLHSTMADGEDTTAAAATSAASDDSAASSSSPSSSTAAETATVSSSYEDMQPRRLTKRKFKEAAQRIHLGIVLAGHHHAKPSSDASECTEEASLVETQQPTLSLDQDEELGDNYVHMSFKGVLSHELRTVLTKRPQDEQDEQR